MDISEITDELIAAVVTVSGAGFAGWVVYQTGEIPQFFAMGFGMVLAYYFGKGKLPTRS